MAQTVLPGQYRQGTMTATPCPEAMVLVTSHARLLDCSPAQPLGADIWTQAAG